MLFDFLEVQKNKFALSISPPQGMAIYSSKIINRNRSYIEITESEIENAISQTIWRLFDEERIPLAKRLDIPEIDVVMADVRVLYIKLDGHQVINPIGFNAKTIEIGLALMIITRDVFESIKSKIPKNGEIIFVLDPAVSYGWIMQKKLHIKNFIIARVLNDKTFIYHLINGSDLSYIDDFNWGASTIIDFISNYFKVSELTAKELLVKYVKKDMSLNTIKNLKKIISPSFTDFSKGMIFATRNVRIKKPICYIFNDILAGLDTKNVLWQESGVKMNFLPLVTHKEIAIREMHECDFESIWNKIARRRMKWLMCYK